MINPEKVKCLLQQASDLIEEMGSAIEQMTPVPASDDSSLPLSQKEYIPAVLRVLASCKSGRGEMHYREIAEVIIEKKLMILGDKDLELIRMNDKEMLPRAFQRVRDAMIDTQLGKQFFERGSKRGYYRLSPLGRQISGGG